MTHRVNQDIDIGPVRMNYKFGPSGMFGPGGTSANTDRVPFQRTEEPRHGRGSLFEVEATNAPRLPAQGFF
jgi:hypothetical protein